MNIANGECPVARALEVLGDKWTLLILRDALTGVRRFDDFERHLGISRPLLAARLKRLVAEGILARHPYRPEGERLRHEYRLTPKGADLRLALIALKEWGERHMAGSLAPFVLFDKHSGQEVRLGMVRTDDGLSV